MNPPFSHRTHRLRRQDGITLIEVILIIGLIGIIIAAVVEFIKPMTQFFQHSRIQQQSNLDLRSCIETMRWVMGNGLAGTCVIAKAANSGTMQHNQASFQTVDGSTYTICWSNQPATSAGSVHMLWTPPGSNVVNDKVLASNVAMLHFAFDAPSDPGIIHVDFLMSVPQDTSGRPDSFMTISPPKLTIRMIAP
jgi:type II secretory pathway pseudopilin PulG